MDPPPSLKMLAPFLLRAKELRAASPIASYYCQFYALELGLKNLNRSDAQATQFIRELMAAVEKRKSEIGHIEDGKTEVELLALKVFERADNEDVAGVANANTARTYRVASILMEVCKTFGELSPDIAEKFKYAKFKANDITRAIKMGVKPTPGPPGQSEEELLAGLAEAGQNATSTASTNQPNNDIGFGLPAAPTNDYRNEPFHSQTVNVPPPSGYPSQQQQPYQQPYQPPLANVHSNPPPHHTTTTTSISSPSAAPKAPAPAPAPVPASSTMHVAADKITLAEKHAKWAVGALQFDDVDQAVLNLKKALEALGCPVK